jgi:hypothetical protein
MFRPGHPCSGTAILAGRGGAALLGRSQTACQTKIIIFSIFPLAIADPFCRIGAHKRTASKIKNLKSLRLQLPILLVESKRTTEDTMKVADGNDKLGKGCVVVSRPVGDTCPSSCVYLNNGCYAEQSEKQYPNVRPAGFHNIITEKNRIRAMILDARKRGKSIRWHERGDWFLNGQLDHDYLTNVKDACESILADGLDLPEMWFYTHIYDAALVSLDKYMAVYASIHNDADMQAAKDAGFQLFAWCDSDEKIAPKRPKANKKKADAWRASLPKMVVLNNEKFVVCPEIRRGRGVVTCTGTKDSIACDMCVRGLANVLFPSH